MLYWEYIQHWNLPVANREALAQSPTLRGEQPTQQHSVLGGPRSPPTLDSAVGGRRSTTLSIASQKPFGQCLEITGLHWLAGRL